MARARGPAQQLRIAVVVACLAVLLQLSQATTTCPNNQKCGSDCCTTSETCLGNNSHKACCAMSKACYGKCCSSSETCAGSGSSAICCASSASSTDTPCGGECCDTSGDEKCTSSYGGRSLLTAMTQQCSCKVPCGRDGDTCCDASTEECSSSKKCVTKCPAGQARCEDGTCCTADECVTDDSSGSSPRRGLLHYGETSGDKICCTGTGQSVCNGKCCEAPFTCQGTGRHATCGCPEGQSLCGGECCASGNCRGSTSRTRNLLTTTHGGDDDDGETGSDGTCCATALCNGKCCDAGTSCSGSGRSASCVALCDNMTPACGSGEDATCCADGECCETTNSGCSNQCGSSSHGGGNDGEGGRRGLLHFLQGGCSGGSHDQCKCKTELCGGECCTTMQVCQRPGKCSRDKGMCCDPIHTCGDMCCDPSKGQVCMTAPGSGTKACGKCGTGTVACGTESCCKTDGTEMCSNAGMCIPTPPYMRRSMMSLRD